MIVAGRHGPARLSHAFAKIGRGDVDRTLSIIGLIRVMDGTWSGLSCRPKKSERCGSFRGVRIVCEVRNYPEPKVDCPRRRWLAHRRVMIPMARWTSSEAIAKPLHVIESAASLKSLHKERANLMIIRQWLGVDMGTQTMCWLKIRKPPCCRFGSIHHRHMLYRCLLQCRKPKLAMHKVITRA
jgi:hypothetical protein